MKVKAYLKSMRLRTLPLSLAGVILGVCAAAGEGPLSLRTVVLLMLTTALLQVLSNLSNELGDTLLGTDSAAERQGLHYPLMDGELTISGMKRFIGVIAGLCCVSGLAMTLSSFGTLAAVEPWLILALGAAAVWAAMHYTLGKHPYGYRGKGDIFVFVFFGLVSTCGSFYICSHSLAWQRVLLPACAMGCFSVGVLNVNNIRDMKTDAATRMTVALRLGATRSRVYQTALTVLGWLLLITHTAIFSTSWKGWLYVITLPLFALQLRGVWTRKDRELDPMLPLLVMSTFALALLAGIGML